MNNELVGSNPRCLSFFPSLFFVLCLFFSFFLLLFWFYRAMLFLLGRTSFSLSAGGWWSQQRPADTHTKAPAYSACAAKQYRDRYRHNISVPPKKYRQIRRTNNILVRLRLNCRNETEMVIGDFEGEDVRSGSFMVKHF